MAIMDSQNELSDAQAVTVTAISTDIIDLNTYPQYAGGEDLNLIVDVNTKFAGGTSIRAVLWTDGTTTTTDGQDIISGDVVATANATAGTNLLTVNLKGLTLERYIGVQYVVVGTMSAGKVDSYLATTPTSGEINLA